MVPQLVFAEPIITHEILNKIKRKCAEAYPDALRLQFVADQGLITAKGIFAASDLEALVVPFTSLLKPNLKFIDLGSGDGRVVFLASLFGVEATGIEFDPDLYEISMTAMKSLSDVIDTGKSHFIQGDFLQHDFSKYDIFYLCAGTNDESALKKKLSVEMKPGSILILRGFEEIRPDELYLIEEFYDQNGDEIKAYGKK